MLKCAKDTRVGNESITWFSRTSVIEGAITTIAGVIIDKDL
jgi:hypothetical protein